MKRLVWDGSKGWVVEEKESQSVNKRGVILEQRPGEVKIKTWSLGRLRHSMTHIHQNFRWPPLRYYRS